MKVWCKKPGTHRPSYGKLNEPEQYISTKNAEHPVTGDQLSKTELT